jgi:plasmid stabilization system protein ParE
MSYAPWTAPAEIDVEDIYGWIAIRDGRMQTAKKILREIRQTCDEYGAAFAAGSVLGTARTDLGESFRLFTYKRWVIVFRPTPLGIEVLRVLDGSRDFSQIFSK